MIREDMTTKYVTALNDYCERMGVDGGHLLTALEDICRESSDANAGCSEKCIFFKTAVEHGYRVCRVEDAVILLGPDAGEGIDYSVIIPLVLIGQAMKDYYNAYQALLNLKSLSIEEREEEGEEYERELISKTNTLLELKRLFYSDWFASSSKTDPSTLIQILESLVYDSVPFSTIENLAIENLEEEVLK